jgi:hypothetical protein
MSKARKLADLLTSSGDVKTDHLDNATYSDATTSAKGLMASGDKSKLDGIETGAKADQTKADIDALGVNASTVNSKTVATNVPSGAVFTDTNTTYSVGDGGLTQKNFTTTLNTKLSGIEDGAKADQTKADIEALGVNASTLDAYNNTAAITGNAVDIFIYDTSKDSDGGAWRKRTQDTSWYNEAASSTRGSRKDFPAVAVIVLESQGMTIYDGDTPDLDMWMVFQHTTSGWKALDYGGGLGQAVTMMNGVMAIGNSIANYGSVQRINFISEEMIFYIPTAYKYGSTIARRNVLQDPLTNVSATYGSIVNKYVNDVAITVLPNAPIDSATGLPTPTIAVATNGGVSIIKDDGTVKNLSGGSQTYIDMYGTDHFIAKDTGDALVIQALNTTATSINYYTGVRTYNGNTATGMYPFLQGNGGNTIAMADTDFAYTANGRLQLYSEVLADARKSSVAYITSKYNTGYMTGNIRGAWNVDTDVTTLGTEIFADNSFTGSGSDWTLSGGNISYDSTNNELDVTAGSGWRTAANSATIKPYGFYNVSFTTGVLSYGDDVIIRVGGLNSLWQTTTTANTTYTAVVQAGGNTVIDLQFGTSFAGSITSVTCKEAIPDRSVKGNGLAVHGTPTVSAVATGAELKYVRCSATGAYLERTVGTEYDFGTGDFCVSGWVSQYTDGGSTQSFFQLGDTSGGYSEISLQRQTSSSTMRLGYKVRGDSGTRNSYGIAGSDIKTGVWSNYALVRRSGTITLYVNGVNLDSTTGATGNIHFGSVKQLRIGNGPYTVTSDVMLNSLIRISATAPTAEQIKEIYEAEKPMFQDNAKCTLNGTSDAVTAMSYDDSNEELLVGTSGGLSVFKGLRRVDENTNNITEVAQQGGLRVEEY